MTRKRHSVEFKARVALEAIKSERLAEVARRKRRASREQGDYWQNVVKGAYPAPERVETQTHARRQRQ